MTLFRKILYAILIGSLSASGLILYSTETKAADAAINQLPNYSGTISGSNLFPITQGGSPVLARQAPLSAVATYITASQAALPTTLTGFTAVNSPITSADTILAALGKAQGQINSVVSGVSSVFGRTGAVVATSGDYTAAQVTNAADKNATATQAFNGPITTGVTSGGGNLRVTNGNVIAGYGGGSNSGSLTTTAGDTSTITLFANPNAAAYNSSITNVSLGQGTVYTLPDAAVGTTFFILSDSPTTQAINSGNIRIAAGYQNFGAISTPATPVASADIYAKTVTGTTSMYTLDSNGVETLVGAGNYWSQSGGIIQPVTAGQILRNTGNFETTNGNISAGNGGVGNSGNFKSYANDGSSLVFNAAANSSPLSNVLSNASTNQISHWVLADPGTSSSTNLLQSNFAGTQTIATGSLALTSGNLSLTAGNLLVPAGYVNLGARATPSTPITSANLYSKTVGGTTGIYGQDSTGAEFLLTQTGGPQAYWSVSGNVIYLTASTTYTAIHLGASDTSSIAFVSNPNTGVHYNTLQNAATGQDTTWTLPDPSVGAVNLLVSDSAGTILRTASANAATIIPTGTASLTINFLAFPNSTDGVALSWKETTAGVPITVKETSRNSSSVTVEIANLSPTTATATTTVSVIATGH